MWTEILEQHDQKREYSHVESVIGLAGQYPAVDENLTGRENLEMIGRLYHLGSEKARSRSGDLLEIFSLTDAAGRTAKTYSGGMRRRLDLAAAFPLGVVDGRVIAAQKVHQGPARFELVDLESLKSEAIAFHCHFQLDEIEVLLDQRDQPRANRQR